MAIVKWEYGKWDDLIGYRCNQCGKFYLSVEGGIRHENEIDRNNGICPEAIKIPHKISHD